MRITRIIAMSLVAFGLLIGCATKEPTPTRHVEELGGIEEISRITTLGGSWPRGVGFWTLDDVQFEELIDELYVRPGCRCMCAHFLPPLGPNLLPICIEAVAGYTYIVSFKTVGWASLQIWINAEKSESITEELTYHDVARIFRSVKPVYSDEDRAVSSYRFNARGKFVPSKDNPELEYCRPPDSVCVFASEENRTN